MASLFKHQEKTLTDRNVDCILGEWRTTLLLLLQAPIIGGLIAWRFHDLKISSFLFFSLALSSLWFGCTNAAREIVREKAIFARERLFGLHLGAYLLAKLKVLSLLGLIQSMALVLLVNYFVALKGFVGLHLLTAFCSTFAGIALGLLLSSLVRSLHQADALVPLVLIPQILFSPVIMPSKLLSGWALSFEKLMPLRWSYSAFKELASAQRDLLYFSKSLGILLAMSLGLLLLSAFLLSRKKMEF